MTITAAAVSYKNNTRGIQKSPYPSSVVRVLSPYYEPFQSLLSTRTIPTVVPVLYIYRLPSTISPICAVSSVTGYYHLEVLCIGTAVRVCNTRRTGTRYTSQFFLSCEQKMHFVLRYSLYIPRKVRSYWRKPRDGDTIYYSTIILLSTKNRDLRRRRWKNNPSTIEVLYFV